MPKYVTLMSSLPPLGQLFGLTQTPLSRLKLENRLKLLDAKDTERLNQIANLIAWSQQPKERTDSQFVADAERLLAELHNPTLQEIITFRFDLRTIIVALRRRHRGETAPPVDQSWGVGRWVKCIEENWTQVGFGLEGMFPWVLEVNRLLKANDSVALERLQFELNWKMLDRFAVGHYFDFEAVVIYLMRWSLVDRWTRYDGEEAVKRFEELVDEGIEKFSDVFA